jgi:hypothetical protein
MILNLLMFFGAFMAFKRPPGRIAAAAVIGVVKGAAYYTTLGDAYISAFMGALFFSMIVGIVGCIVYLDAQPTAVPVYPRYGERYARPFQWVYIPLSILVFSVLFGEITAVCLFA